MWQKNEGFRQRTAEHTGTRLFVSTMTCGHYLESPCQIVTRWIIPQDVSSIFRHSYEWTGSYYGRSNLPGASVDDKRRSVNLGWDWSKYLVSVFGVVTGLIVSPVWNLSLRNGRVLLHTAATCGRCMGSGLLYTRERGCCPITGGTWHHLTPAGNNLLHPKIIYSF